MIAAPRLVGSLASGGANLLLYGSLLALWPALEDCAFGHCFLPDPEPLVAVDTWRPFIDNPEPGGVMSRREPECPSPTGTGDQYGLEAAPLPEGYDPHGQGERQVYACVLVAAGGEVLGARMLRGTGHRAQDSSLLRTIRHSWRLRRHHGEAAPSWQRVRLNSGAVEGAVWEAPLIL